jgi:hypothetical protein
VVEPLVAASTLVAAAVPPAVAVRLRSLERGNLNHRVASSPSHIPFRLSSL